MVRYAGEFGLTPVARARIAAGPCVDRPGKLDSLLAYPGGVRASDGSR
jgi:hypothetical protein